MFAGVQSFTIQVDKWTMPIHATEVSDSFHHEKAVTCDSLVYMD